jgi:sugar lactone lactonase YvrE
VSGSVSRPQRAVPEALSLHPAWAVEGARVTVRGPRFSMSGDTLPRVCVGGIESRVVMGATTRLTFIVPAGLGSGGHDVTVDGVDGLARLQVGGILASGIHQVDNPAIDHDGNVYLTHSGARGQRTPVSVFRVTPGGERQPFVTDVVNATSLAFDAHGVLHVSSRFDGVVYRVKADRTVETIASDLGVACGIAFGSDGTLFVGDRNGTVFSVSAARKISPFATLPGSLAAFHLAAGPDSTLYVTAPTLGTYDHVYRLDVLGGSSVVSTEFGRPQGCAVDDRGDLYVVEAVAGGSGLYRVRPGEPRELVLSAPALVGVALDPRGGLVVSSNDTAYRLDVPLRPFIA